MGHKYYEESWWVKLLMSEWGLRFFVGCNIFLYLQASLQMIYFGPSRLGVFAVVLNLTAIYFNTKNFKGYKENKAFYEKLRKDFERIEWLDGKMVEFLDSKTPMPFWQYAGFNDEEHFHAFIMELREDPRGKA